MTKWEPTPFESIAQARALLERVGAKIMDEPDRPGFVAFATLSEDYERVIIAQRVEGGPVMQYVRPLKVYVPEEQYEVGPWVECDHDGDHKTFDAVLDHYDSIDLGGQGPTVVKCETMYLTSRDDSGLVREYRMVTGRLQMRVLEMKSRRFTRERAGSGHGGEKS